MQLLDLVTNVSDLALRGDIRRNEKFALVRAYVQHKLRGSATHTPFLSYTIDYLSRGNAAEIIKEVFYRGDYAFKTGAPAPRILDVGANIGITTLFLSATSPIPALLRLKPCPTM